MAATDARPVPRKNTAYRVTFPILDADGDLVTGAAGLDSQVSIDAGTFAACTNEATEIATSSGVYYLDLTAAEMNGDTIAVIVKTSTSGAKTTTIVMYPEESGDYRADVVQWNGTAVATPTVAGVPEVDVTHFNGTAGTFSAGRPEVNTTHAAGTAWGSGAITASSIAASALNGKGDWNIGKTGYSLTQTFPTNFSDLAITASTGRVTVGTNADKTGYSLVATTGLGNQTADITGSLSGSVGSVTGAVGSVTGNVGGNVVGSVGSVTGSIGSLAAQAKTDVNAEVVDALATDTYAEPAQGALAATASLATKINCIYKFLRNKITTTSTQISVYDDAGTTIDHKSTISDDATTFTRGEFGSGP